MPIMAELLIVGGLFLGLWGSWKLYRSDSPRNEWMLSVLSSTVRAPRTAVMAGERTGAEAGHIATAPEIDALRVSGQSWIRAARDGWLLLALGFLFQAMGTLLILIPVMMRYAGAGQ
jgi:hypothetical protein